MNGAVLPLNRRQKKQTPSEYFDKATAKEALYAAGEIIRFCENIVGGL
jgi:HEPN domain-containing protein